MISLPLSQGKVALLDDEDAALAAFKWYAARNRNTWYAQRNVVLPGGRRTVVMLHREVWLRAHPGEAPPQEIDHRNGNGLECARDNLRAASKVENGRNQMRAKNNASGFKGVSWAARKRRWRAMIVVRGSRQHVGYFTTPEEAARAYDAAARAVCSQFACTNFPVSGERPAIVAGGGACQT